MGRIKLKTVSDLMDIANRFADGEDACNNKWTRSTEDDRGNRYGSWYVSDVSIIFDAPCFFLHHLPNVLLHFVALLCIFRN
jgi:hypothetical protein